MILTLLMRLGTVTHEASATGTVTTRNDLSVLWHTVRSMQLSCFIFTT